MEKKERPHQKSKFDEAHERHARWSEAELARTRRRFEELMGEGATEDPSDADADEQEVA